MLKKILVHDDDGDIMIMGERYRWVTNIECEVDRREG